MRMFLCLVLCLFSAIAPQDLYAQTSSNADSVLLVFRPYTSIRGQFAFYNAELEVQENGSRIGFEISSRYKKLRLFAGIELQVNLFRSESSFNLSNNTADGYIVADRVQARQVLASRLGFLGADFGKNGQITFGKQYSVYYDITSMTDKFTVFGAGASSTFVAGTDGGVTGTGRADQALSYRNKFGPVSVGAQLQFESADNNNIVDGLGICLKTQVWKKLEVGVAYNRMFLDHDLIENNAVIGLERQPSWLAVGANYSTNTWELAVVYAHQLNGDLTNGQILNADLETIYPSVIFDADGWEGYGRYNWHRLSVMAGFNLYNPKNDIITPSGQRPLSADFKRRYYIIGTEFRPYRFTRLYAEGRIANGANGLGVKEQTVFTIGLRFDIEQTMTKRFLVK